MAARRRARQRKGWWLPAKPRILIFSSPTARRVSHRVTVIGRRMNQRQQRTDIDMANAVARGVNIFEMRGPSIARHYMRHKGVPDAVIDRILDVRALRRAPSPEQAVSEAITPTPPDDE